MISIEAAGILAQVIPVGLLVLAFENGGQVEGTTRAGRVWLWVFRIAVLVSVLWSLSAETYCISSVASGVALRGFNAIWVGGAATLLSVMAGVAILLGAMTTYGIVDAIQRRALKNLAVRTRVEKHLRERDTDA